MAIYIKWQDDEPNIVARIRRIADRTSKSGRPCFGFKYQRTLRIIEGFDPPHVDPARDVVITVGRRWLWKHLSEQQLAEVCGHILQGNKKWIQVEQ